MTQQMPPVTIGEYKVIPGEDHCVGERHPAHVEYSQRTNKGALLVLVSAPIFPRGCTIPCQWQPSATEAPPDVGDDGFILYTGWHRWKFTGLYL